MGIPVQKIEPITITEKEKFRIAKMDGYQFNRCWKKYQM
jgi:hypothetical protein